MSSVICYCFGYTDDDIAKDAEEHHGHSTILDRITEAKKHNRCECEVRHPEKR